MKTQDLWRELAVAYMGLTAAQAAWIGRCGAGFDVRRDRSGPLGAAVIVPDGVEKGLFDYADEGATGAVAVIIQGVFGGLYAGPVAGRRPDLIDVVAWNPHQPEKWWLRCGGVAWLNALAVRMAADDGWDEKLWGYPRPDLSLFSSPHGWLRAGAPADGAVLLNDGGRLWRDLLAGVGKVIVPDVAFADVAYKQIRKRPPQFKLPEVWLADDASEQKEESA